MGSSMGSWGHRRGYGVSRGVMGSVVESRGVGLVTYGEAYGCGGAGLGEGVWGHPCVPMCPYESLWAPMCPRVSIYVPMCVPMRPYVSLWGPYVSLYVLMRPYVSL